MQLPHLSGFIFTSMGTSENFELKLALRALVTLIYVDIRKSDINCSHAPGRVTEQVKIVRISTNDCGWNIYITLTIVKYEFLGSFSKQAYSWPEIL